MPDPSLPIMKATEVVNGSFSRFWEVLSISTPMIWIVCLCLVILLQFDLGCGGGGVALLIISDDVPGVVGAAAAAAIADVSFSTSNSEQSSPPTTTAQGRLLICHTHSSKLSNLMILTRPHRITSLITVGISAPWGSKSNAFCPTTKMMGQPKDMAIWRRDWMLRRLLILVMIK